MAAETVDTYTFTPPARSDFSPENISGEMKTQPAVRRSQSTSKPMELKPVSA